ncbi:MAG: ATPase domain-containing protein, partial [Polyangiaceae bacterium]
MTGEETSRERVATGVRGLDTILRGGLFRGSVYLLQANPGSGKTILGNQICFNHVATGGRAVFVTLLTESHSKLLAQLENLGFFDPKVVGDALTYVTAYQALEKDNLKGLLILLRKIVRDHDATMLVVDGIVTAGAMAESGVEVKNFIHELQAFVELVGCTTLLLTGPSEARNEYALRTMVDGLIELHLEPVGMEAVRTLEITKLRGSGTLLGRHPFEINDQGIVVYPRIESDRGRAAERPDCSDGRPTDFGIERLDEMLGGGLQPGSVTLCLGTPGSGKTLLGMSLLDHTARAKRKGLFFGFFEAPSTLPHKGKLVGIEWSSHIEKGLL